MLALVVSASLAASPATSLITNPTDVRGVVRGAQAVALDPAGAVLADGSELAVRSRLTEPDSRRQWGVYAVAPLGGLSLTGGYEWLEGSVDRRVTLGFGFVLSRDVSIGLAWHHLDGRGDANADVWDASLLTVPARWLSVVLGVEQMNQPRFAGARLERTYHGGLGVRPVAGAPWLTLGAEADLRLEEGERVFSSARVLLDVAPLRGLHARVAYAPDDDELWLGLSASLMGFEVAAAAGGEPQAAGDTGGGAVTLTLREEPVESLVEPTYRTVEVPLTGKLRDEGGLLGVGDPISPLPLALARLATDPTVARVVLAIGDLDVGPAQVDELRAAVAELRAAGKHVTAELVGGSEREYLVAAAADRIRLDPATVLVLDGYSVTLFYLADALAKLGVRFDAVAVGKYKTGPDSLTRSGSRAEEREVIRELLDQLQRSLAGALVRDRHLEPAVIERVLARGLVTPAQALELGLVDELSQPTDPTVPPVLRAAGEALARATRSRATWGEPPKIAVVPVVGNITADGAAGILPGGSASARTIISQVDAARLDPEVRAVVLRVDSPGGEVLASELIWRAVRLLAAAKPTVVSMGEVAASGGYYIAAPAHAILAQPSTLTGSIGIFMVKPDLSRLLDLTGVNAEVMQVGPRADWSSPLRALTDEERATVREALALDYETFLNRVAQGRRMPMERVRELGEGRVYTGERAMALGLVDELGGLSEAVAKAAELAGLDPADVEVKVVKEPFSLGAALGSLVTAARADLGIGELLGRVRALGSLPLARLPFEVVIDP